MAYRAIWEDDGIKWIFHGDLTNEDFMQRGYELYEDHRYESIKYQIFDFSDIDEVMVETDIVQCSASLDALQSLRNPDVKIAFISVRQVVFGLKRMYETYHQLEGGSWQCRVFNTEVDARAWFVDETKPLPS